MAGLSPSVHMVKNSEGREKEDWAEAIGRILEYSSANQKKKKEKNADSKSIATQAWSKSIWWERDICPRDVSPDTLNLCAAELAKASMHKARMEIKTGIQKERRNMVEICKSTNTDCAAVESVYGFIQSNNSLVAAWIS